ncbi:hypothetical protein CDAR_494341 [Caerostris darwini]|uniref:Uncharacterized protein n=1 Tax=Caerostris darwini TaxID=1538125 RepID=A0AAV4TMY1_9ARAC|nr:hypothetical protein CDAR_494341 [Caerostris darwini]
MLSYEQKAKLPNPLNEWVFLPTGLEGKMALQGSPIECTYRGDFPRVGTGGGGRAHHLRGAGLQVEKATPYATMRNILSSPFSFSAPMGLCVRHA